MARINIADELNGMLMTKQNADDIPVTLNMPEHMFKKVSNKFNRCLIELYNKYKSKDVKMFDILMSLDPYFEFGYMVENILDKKIINHVRKEIKAKEVLKNDTQKNNK